MSSAGTAEANAWSAAALWSRAVGIIPISFSTCTITTVCRVPSVSRRCFSRAAKARASLSRFAAENGESISCGVPSWSAVRGKRLASRFTHAGA